ncbi:MAG: hypothetical protein Q9M09_00080 [Mariprofundaceae bacterium]|nr:hypothetical protein [Mariprofundaceae bacterium]
MNAPFSRLLMAVIAISCLPTMSHAAQWDVSLSPALWQYRESAGATAGFTGSTPLTSSASGKGVLVDMHIAQDLGAWTLSWGGEWLTSLGTQQERWQQPTQQQTNNLSIQHGEIHAAAHWHWNAVSPLFSVGAWGAWQYDIQRRSDFISNGSAAVIAPIRELIRVSWAGLSLMGESENHYFHVRLDAGMPLAVKTTNDVLPGVVFNTRQGVRWQVNANYRLLGDEHGVSTRVVTSYRFRQLGHEVQPQALWPKNRWQVFSLGVQQTW